MCKKVLSERGEKRLRSVYEGIKDRCYNPKAKSYKYYGARGICVCDVWLNSYAEFRDWAIESGYVEDAPRGKCTIDRIDCNGNYEPDNCRWVDMKVQSVNKRHYKSGCNKAAEIASVDDGSAASQNLRARIDSYTEKNLITVSEFARLIGISRTSFYNKLSGKNQFLFSEAVELAKMLGITVDELARIIYSAP